MNHSHSTVYRICLLAVVILTIAGGIFYYVNYVENQATVTEGTLVQSEEPAEEEAVESFKPSVGTEEEAVESFRPSASRVKCA